MSYAVDDNDEIMAFLQNSVIDEDEFYSIVFQNVSMQLLKACLTNTGKTAYRRSSRKSLMKGNQYE